MMTRKKRGSDLLKFFRHLLFLASEHEKVVVRDDGSFPPLNGGFKLVRGKAKKLRSWPQREEKISLNQTTSSGGGG